MHSGGFGGGRGFGGSRDFNEKAAPVRVGEEVDVTIEAVGAKGDGIAKKEGFVIFVPNTSTGDNVKIRITKVLSNVAFAELAGKGGSSQQKKESRERSREESEGQAGSAETVEQPVDTENFGEEEQ
ncbi:TRAM domain-containing protein [Candidatus Woesearchaeota archaeon]|nr:TRAM domain-containing protein [Candidatus Woesearchaeota archaeon]